jgi:hypothetical protein
VPVSIEVQSQLLQPDDFSAGGVTWTVRYRNPETYEIKAMENRSEESFTGSMLTLLLLSVHTMLTGVPMDLLSLLPHLSRMQLR